MFANEPMGVQAWFGLEASVVGQFEFCLLCVTIKKIQTDPLRKRQSKAPTAGFALAAKR
jgi:hypothetical protein